MSPRQSASTCMMMAAEAASLLAATFHDKPLPLPAHGSSSLLTLVCSCWQDGSPRCQGQGHRQLVGQTRSPPA